MPAMILKLLHDLLTSATDFSSSACDVACPSFIANEKICLARIRIATSFVVS
jgi:hypothetical protein